MEKGRKIILFMAFVLGIAIVRISLDENISKNIFRIMTAKKTIIILIQASSKLHNYIFPF